MVEHLQTRLLNYIKLENLKHMEYADTNEDRFVVGFTIVGLKLERCCATRYNYYIFRCDDVHADLSGFKSNERITFAYRDEKR